MSEEIKEIAESLREISTPTGLSYSGDRTLNNSYTEKIIDYITNLQQKVEQLNNIINELEKWLKDNIEYGDDDYYDMKAMGVESALNKLKELKEKHD